MKNVVILLVLILALNSSCKKKTNCDAVNTTAPATEIQTLKDYITNNSIIASEDSRGFYYDIINTGSGDKPTVCNDVKVNYIGKLTNGTIFDQANGVSFSLSKLIVGWQEGIPLIGAGGRIKLYLPPSLAYGSSASGSIPANSILIFEIDLLGF